MERISFKDGVAGAVDSRIGGRKENQDHFTYSDTPLGPLVVVCDGMGGGPAGKTASSLAADTIVERVVASLPSDDPADALDAAIRSANQALTDAISANPQLAGMGTTCVCVLFSGGSAYIGHVGDSRCYQLRNHKIRFRTTDHSQVAELVKMGTLTEEQARVSPYSNIITRAIGIQPMVQPEIDKVSYKPGDRFALMSDGIWGTVSEPILVAELTESSSAEATVSGLVERTDGRGQRKGGKHDNLTLAVVDVESKPDTGSRRWKRMFTFSLLTCVVVAAAALGYMWLKPQPVTAKATGAESTVTGTDDTAVSEAEETAPATGASPETDGQPHAPGETVGKTLAAPGASSVKDLTSGTTMLQQIASIKQTLEELNDFWSDHDTPKSTKPAEWEKCLAARKALFDKAVADLDLLSGTCDDKMKERIGGIIILLKDKQPVVVTPDKKHGRTTKDGASVIKNCIEKLNKLTNQ